MSYSNLAWASVVVLSSGVGSATTQAAAEKLAAPKEKASAAALQVTGPLIALSQQRAALSGSGALTLDVRLTNSLTEPEFTKLVEIELGWVLGENEDQLRDADVARLYQRCPADQEVRAGSLTVLRRTLDIRLGPGESHSATIESDLPAGASTGAFVTHLLGYRLAPLQIATADSSKRTAQLLVQMLLRDQAADEVAALRSVGLVGKTPAALDNADVFGEALLQQLDNLAKKKADPKRTAAVAFVALSLRNIRQGERLKTWKPQQDLSAFDENLQVLRTARLLNTPLETPLAFALPSKINTTEALLKYASGVENSGAAAEVQPSDSGAVATGGDAGGDLDASAAADTDEQQGAEPSSAIARLAGAAALVVLSSSIITLGFLEFRRRKKHLRAEPQQEGQPES